MWASGPGISKIMSKLHACPMLYGCQAESPPGLGTAWGLKQQWQSPAEARKEPNNLTSSLSHHGQSCDSRQRNKGPREKGMAPGKGARHVHRWPSPKNTMPRQQPDSRARRGPGGTVAKAKASTTLPPGDRSRPLQTPAKCPKSPDPHCMVEGLSLIHI